MGNPNRDGRNQEYAPMEESKYRLSWIWCHGLNSLWNRMFIGIVVPALHLLLALPPIVVLSVFEFVLSAPFGFMFSVCPAIHEIMSILFGEPRLNTPLYSVSEDLCSYDLGYEDDEDNEKKGHEQDYDLVDFEEGIAGKFEEKEYEEVKGYTNERADGAEKDAFRLRKRLKDSNNTSTVEFDDVEREKLSKEKKREIRADEKQCEDKSVPPSTRMTSPFLSWESSGSFGNLEELLEPSEDESVDGFQDNCDEVEEKIEQSSKIEPGELVKETMEMAEAVRNEGEAEIENIQQSMQEATSTLPSASASVNGAVLDLERVKLLAVEDSVVDVPRLQTIDEQMESSKLKKKDGKLASLQVEFQHTTNTAMEVDMQRRE